MADAAETVATPAQTDIEASAAEMKVLARTRALAAQQQKRPRRKREEAPATATAPEQPRAPRRPRRVVVQRDSAPVAALRRAIRDHEREIKRLNRALKAIGG